MESSDPNDDPEFVRLFTISDTDDDSDSDEDYFTSSWRIGLQPTEIPYDRAARVQQANRELFSQPNSKKKPKSKVKFDPIPQNIIDEEAADEGGEGESANMENANSNLQTRIQRRDTGTVILLPRRFSSLQHHNYNNVNTEQNNVTVSPSPSPDPAPRMSHQPTREDQQPTGQNRHKEERESPEQSQSQSHTPKPNRSEETPPPSEGTIPLVQKKSSKQQNPEPKPHPQNDHTK